MASNGFEDLKYQSNGNGDYHPRHNDNNELGGTKRSIDEPDESHHQMPHKKMRRQEARTEMRCLVPSKTAGGIIGKGGCNIKDMRESFSAQIQIPDSDAPERVLQVRASPESCGEILLRVLPTINESGSGRFRPGEANNMSIKLLVHQSQAGGVIGVKGYKIKELREKTGASIKVHQECAPNSTDRICVIIGVPDVISECVVLIMELLVNTPPKGPVQNFDPAFDPSFSGGGMNEGFGFKGGFGGGFAGGMDNFGGGRNNGGGGGGRFGGGPGRGGGGGNMGQFNMGRGSFRGAMRGGRGGMNSFRGRDFGGPLERGGRMGSRGGASYGGRGGSRSGGNYNRDHRGEGGGFRGRGGPRGGNSGMGNMRGRSGDSGYENY